jgi:serine/threonine protein kinase
MPEIGQTLSHYRIIGKLGQGSMGEVFFAEDTSLDRKVALKFLSRNLQEDAVALERFLREAKSAAALDHPCICSIHDVVKSDHQHFIVMEHVDGQTLKEKIEQGPTPLGELLQIAEEIAGALEEAHEKQIIHRDLKPSNIMLTGKGRPKVMDFGLAKHAAGPEDSQEDTLTGLTQEGTTMGTLPYMSPEQARGQIVDRRSDIFSFGIVLYEMIARTHPFQRGTPMETVGAILHTRILPPCRTMLEIYRPPFRRSSRDYSRKMSRSGISPWPGSRLILPAYRWKRMSRKSRPSC